MEERIKAIEVLKTIDKFIDYRNKKIKEICDNDGLTFEEVLDKTAQLDARTLTCIIREISIFEQVNDCVLNPIGP